MGTKYSPAELTAHREQWWANCAAHPDEPFGLALEVSYKSIERTADVHEYRLIVAYTNTTPAAHDGWKLQIYLPSFLPYSQGEFDAYENLYVGGERYTELEAESQERVYPGETLRITTRESLRFIGYMVTHQVYLRSLKRGGEVRWKFYTPNTPLVEGSRKLSELHEF
jgi:hypothetical protein